MSNVETADYSRRRRVMSGQGMAVATEDFEVIGYRFRRGVDRIALDHSLLKLPAASRRFVACESPAGRAVIRSGRHSWRLRSRRGDRPRWSLQVEEVR